MKYDHKRYSNYIMKTIPCEQAVRILKTPLNDCGSTRYYLGLNKKIIQVDSLPFGEIVLSEHKEIGHE